MALEINSNITYPSGDYLLSPKTPAMNHDTGGRYGSLHWLAQASLR